MDGKCPNCKESIQYTESPEECLNCGFVISTSQYVSDQQPWSSEQCSKRFPSNYASDIARKAQLNRECFPSIAKGRKLGKKFVERVGQILSCPAEVMDDAKLLFDRVFDHESFNKRRIQTKMCIAAACIYIICRQRNYVITLREVAEVAHCATSELDHFKKEILTAFGIEIKSVDLLELAEIRCEKVGLGRNIIASTVQIIKLCQRLWFLEGRNPENVVLVSSYVAWQSEQPNERVKTNFRSFCKLFNIESANSLNTLVALIRSVLCELAAQIPWVGNTKMNPAHVALYVQDIIKFQNTLIAEANAKFQLDLNELSSDSSFDMSDSENCHESPNSSTTREVETTLMSQASSSSSQNESPSVDLGRSENVVTSQKRGACEFGLHVIARRKKKKTHLDSVNRLDDLRVQAGRDLDCNELGNDDIHEDDMHLFVKTDDEVKKELVLKQFSQKDGIK